MNKYQGFARRVAETICELMNLFYKKNESKQFKEELDYYLQFIRFVDGKWEISRWGSDKDKEMKK